MTHPKPAEPVALGKLRPGMLFECGGRRWRRGLLKYGEISGTTVGEAISETRIFQREDLVYPVLDRTKGTQDGC